MSNNLSQNEVDKIVVSQVDDDEAWEKPIYVNRERTVFLNFPKAFEIVSDKNILSGTPVFRGTQVPVSALLDDLENGVSLDEFIDRFPSVKREQAIKILELFKTSLSQLKAA